MYRRASKHLLALASFVLLAVCLAPAHAQQITGDINGTVRDSSGAVVVGATVEITNTDTNELVRTLKTDKNGEYSATILQVGTYKIAAEFKGFQKTEIVNVQLNVGDALSRDIKLVPGAQDEVSVTADEQKPNIENNDSATLIDSTQIKELALNTRNFEQILLLQPGVSYGGPDELNSGQIDPSGARNSHSISVNGLQPTQVQFLLDGADMANHTSNNQVSIFPTVDAIQQIQSIRNNYGAQYGGGGSAQVSVVTKAGGADFHGVAYYFFRHQSLEATPVFDLIDGIPKPSDRYNDFGYAIGGPLFIPKLYPRDKSKTFFFFSQEFKRLGQSAQNLVSNYPPLAETFGFFPSAAGSVNGVGGAVPVTNSPFPGYNYEICVKTTQTDPGVVIPACAANAPLADPVAQEYLDDVFRPSVLSVPPSATRVASQALFQQVSTTSETEELVRIDQQFSERLNGFFRYVYDPVTQQIPNEVNRGMGYPGVSNTTVFTYGENFLGHLTWTARPTTVVELGYSYLPYETDATPTGSAVAANSPDVHVNLPYTNTTGRIPTLIIVSGQFGAIGPFKDKSATTQVFENTTQTLGRHTLYFGANFEHLTDVANQGTNNSGVFNVNDTAAGVGQFDESFGRFELGLLDSFTQSTIDPTAGPHANLYELYFQDNWKATSTLTLNAGVRYSIFQAPGDFSPDSTGKFPNGKLGVFQPQAYNPAMAPTIGIDGNICTPGSSAPACANKTYNMAATQFNGIVGGGASISPYGHAVSRTPLLDFAPRVGFAWNVYGDGKTSLRGGFGIYYEQQPLITYQNAVDGNPVYVQNPVYSPPASFLNPGTTAVGTAAIGAISGVVRNWKQPYVESWNLDIQQQIGKSDLVDIAYVGNNTVHLQGEEDENQIRVNNYLLSGTTGYCSPTGTKPNCLTGKNVTCTSQLTTGQCYPASNLTATIGGIAGINTEAALNQIRPYLGYTAINNATTRFFADYNGLQASLIHRAGKKATIGVNYTWSRAMANDGGPPNPGSNAQQYDPQYTYNIHTEWGSTLLDRRNVFVVHAVYQLPSHSAWHGFKGGLLNGWELSGIYQAVSGIWWTAFNGTNDPGGTGLAAVGGNVVGRPNLNADPNHGPHTQLNWFKHDVCTGSCTWTAQSTQGTVGGNSRVGAILGPGYQNFTFDLFKNIELPENMKLQIRAEAFNLPNHVSWKNIDTQTGNASAFGTVTSAYENRKLQFGAKLTF